MASSCLDTCAGGGGEGWPQEYGFPINACLEFSAGEDDWFSYNNGLDWLRGVFCSGFR